jgi:hypothetical protein
LSIYLGFWSLVHDRMIRAETGEAAGQDFSGTGVKLDDTSTSAAEVGGEDAKALLGEYFQCTAAIERTDGGTVGANSRDRKNVRAPEDFDFDLRTGDAEGVEPAREITNRRVHVPVFLGVKGTGGTLGEDAMAKCTGARPRTPEGHPNAGPEDGFEHRRTAADVEFTRLDIDRRKVRHHAVFL